VYRWSLLHHGLIWMILFCYIFLQWWIAGMHASKLAHQLQYQISQVICLCCIYPFSVSPIMQCYKEQHYKKHLYNLSSHCNIINACQWEVKGLLCSTSVFKWSMKNNMLLNNPATKIIVLCYLPIAFSLCVLPYDSTPSMS